MSKKQHKREDVCNDCVFFDAATDANGQKQRGRCRRYPPAVAGETPAPIWPKVHSGDWCGEFKAAGK